MFSPYFNIKISNNLGIAWVQQLNLIYSSTHVLYPVTFNTIFAIANTSIYGSNSASNESCRASTSRAGVIKNVTSESFTPFEGCQGYYIIIGI